MPKQARKFIELLYDLLVPATAPRFRSQDRVALVFRVCILLFIALFAGFAIGTKAT